jgi:hypothetical protein
MGSPEVVFDEPLGEPPVEQLRIVRHVAEGEEFILERAVEAFGDRIVFRGFHAGPVMRKLQRLAGFVEMPMELAPVVSLHVLDLSIKQDMQTMQKIAGLAS